LDSPIAAPRYFGVDCTPYDGCQLVQSMDMGSIVNFCTYILCARVITVTLPVIVKTASAQDRMFVYTNDFQAAKCFHGFLINVL
jgi:hypothetical protein